MNSTNTNWFPDLIRISLKSIHIWWKEIRHIFPNEYRIQLFDIYDSYEIYFMFEINSLLISYGACVNTALFKAGGVTNLARWQMNGSRSYQRRCKIWPYFTGLWLWTPLIFILCLFGLLPNRMFVCWQWSTLLWVFNWHRDDVITWTRFPHYWTFDGGIHWSPVISFANDH